MRRILWTALWIMGCAWSAHAFEFNVDPTQTGSISVSTMSSTPTQIFNNDMSAMRTYVVNTSTQNVFIVGFSTSALSLSSAAVVSTSLSSGSFYIQGTLIGSTTIQATTWSPDGMTDPYRGPLWAVSGGTGAVFIQRFRAH